MSFPYSYFADNEMLEASAAEGKVIEAALNAAFSLARDYADAHLADVNDQVKREEFDGALQGAAILAYHFGSRQWQEVLYGENLSPIGPNDRR
jgi:hypothetical protein